MLPLHVHAPPEPPVPDWEARESSDRRHAFLQSHSATVPAGREQVAMWISEYQRLTGDRGRGTEGVCNGAIVPVRFSGQQNFPCWPKAAQGHHSGGDLPFMDIWTCVQLMAIIHKRL